MQIQLIKVKTFRKQSVVFVFTFEISQFLLIKQIILFYKVFYNKILINKPMNILLLHCYHFHLTTTLYL
jgi:hypothetical protein